MVLVVDQVSFTKILLSPITILMNNFGTCLLFLRISLKPDVTLVPFSVRVLYYSCDTVADLCYTVTAPQTSTD